MNLHRKPNDAIDQFSHTDYHKGNDKKMQEIQTYSGQKKTGTKQKHRDKNHQSLS